KRGESQKVKHVVEKLNNEKLTVKDIHQTVYRPWGSYTVFESEPGYKIKKIIVKPGERLSLQKHYHRNEHWVVVSGTATVTIGDEVRYIRPNESTYIKMGEVHRLANEGKIPVVLIEVQVGEYTEEDDIVRIDDDYKRESL
ncbi:MAG TPA: cupin domain-containing protein, partial [Spirochaetales bacterium]|nr:cupin domain-containing protein [Spirochaetales bacterium]